MTRLFIGFHIQFSNTSDFSDSTTVYIDNSTESTANFERIIQLESKIARFVRISIPGERRKLVLREVWILGGM